VGAEHHHVVRALELAAGLALACGLSACQRGAAPPSSAAVQALDAGSARSDDCRLSKEERAAIQSVVDRERGAFDGCADCQACAIDVTLTISPDGRVTEAVVADADEAAVVPESVRACVLQASKKFAFPPSPCPSTWRMHREFRPVE
jgi:hypothetical protein